MDLASIAHQSRLVSFAQLGNGHVESVQCYGNHAIQADQINKLGRSLLAKEGYG